MKRCVLIWLLSCAIGLIQLSAKTATDSVNMAKVKKSDEELLSEALENGDFAKGIRNTINAYARESQRQKLEAWAEPTPIEPKTDFGSQSIDYSLTHGGFIPSDLLYDQGLLDRRRAEIKKKNATKGVLIIFSIAVVGFGIFCIVKSRKKFSEIDTNEKS